MWGGWGGVEWGSLPFKILNLKRCRVYSAKSPIRHSLFWWWWRACSPPALHRTNLTLYVHGPTVGHFSGPFGDPWASIGALGRSLRSLWAPMETPSPLLGTPRDPSGISEDPIWNLWELLDPLFGTLGGPTGIPRKPFELHFQGFIKFSA